MIYNDFTATDQACILKVEKVYFSTYQLLNI